MTNALNLTAEAFLPVRQAGPVAHVWPLGVRRCGMRKWRVTDTLEEEPVMEAEHINQIGAQLTDLSARTEALRGYL